MNSTVFFIFCFYLCLLVERITADGFFWHITDLHVDQNYSRNGDPSKLCHEDGTTTNDTGIFGNFLCDSPQYLVNTTIFSMKKIHSNPDFIIWTGDNLPHTFSFDPEWNVVNEAIKNITTLMSSMFPGVPIYPAIGNHDTFPPNVLPSNSTSIYNDYLRRGGWDHILPSETWSTFSKGGYYSHHAQTLLKIISVNTILWYSPNYFTSSLSDPLDQFKWLENELDRSFSAGEKVYIIGHVPPGFYNRVKPGKQSQPTFHSQHLSTYLKLLSKYSSIIFGQLYGHYHLDMFQLFQFNTGVFKSSALLASSVTPWHSGRPSSLSLAVNPSLRLMRYSHQNYLLLDYSQFYLNLSKANNMHRHSKMKEDIFYELLYTFTESYHVKDLSTTSLVQLFEKLKSSDQYYDIFYKFMTAGKESDICDQSCKVAQLCAMACTSYVEYSSCMMKGNVSASILNIVHEKKYHSEELLFIIISTVLIIFSLFIIIRKKIKSRKQYEVFANLS